MRILELTGFCANYGSNFIPTLECLDETCQKLGHDLFYIFSDANPSQKFFEWEIPFSNRHNTSLFDFGSKNFEKNVANYIIEHQIDVVHGDFIRSIQFSNIKKMSPKHVKFYQHIHNSMYKTKNLYEFCKRIRNLLFLDKSILKICCSESLVPSAEYMFPFSKVVSCKNAIELNRLEPSERNDCSTFNMLLFGHNYYVKGVDLAIEAAIELNKKHPVHLDIVMSNNMEKNKRIIIEKYGCIPSCISILEPVSNVVEVYKNHKVFLNASIEEGMSYANIEAYYCGNLCVYSDIPQNKEPGLPNVIYFTSGSLDSLITAINCAYNKRESYVNDINYVVNNFSLQSWADKMVKLMNLN
ncbi:glycosyltransferase family 4 protein [Sporofaciens sp. SGI.106]|uniref:glycosyltransferase family 4 protein n=1 Tax=Sporofaciens sp. SGI.106 TaxID=3420568 RepID=UPI003D02D8CF